MAVYLTPILLATLLAVLHHHGILKLGRPAITVFALMIGFISGIRFETAQDWDGYEKFFLAVNISVDPLTSYLQHDQLPIFESGFHLLSYAVKWLGGSYLVVSLLASMFCALSLAYALNRLEINRFYVLAVYCSYSYLLLHFAQVRQSIAIGIFLIGITHYIRHQRMFAALGIMLIAPLFQYSAMLYVVLFAVAMNWPKRPHILATAFIICCIIISALTISNYADPYAILAKVAVSELAQAKIEIYQEDQVAGGSGVIVIACYVVAMLTHQIIRTRQPTRTQEVLLRLSIAFAAMTIIMIVVFPNSYVMFSRIYVGCSIVQALACATLLRHPRFALDSIAIYGSLVFSIAYFSRLFSLYADEYLPFRTYLSPSSLW